MNTRKDNNGKALKAWKKMGVGNIAKPLRHIRGKAGEDSATYRHAYHSDRKGRGDVVQAIARTIS